MLDETARFVKESDSLPEDGVKFRIGNHELIYPRNLMIKLLRRTRYYSTEDINDVITNYDQLSRTQLAPLSLIIFLSNAISSFCKKDRKFKEEYMDLIRGPLYRKLQANGSGLLPKMNFNSAMIGNVYLRGFDFVKIPSLEACVFDVVDHKEHMLKGALAYKHVPSLQTDVIASQELGKAIASDGRTTFDLMYRASPGGMNDYFQLCVSSIKQSMHDEENPFFIPNDDSVPSPILVLR